MADKHTRPEGKVWSSAIIPMASMPPNFYIPPLIGHWLLPCKQSAP